MKFPFQRGVTWLYLKFFLIGSIFRHPDRGKLGIIGNFYCSGMATQVFLKGSEVLYQKNQEWSLYINFFTGPCGRAWTKNCKGIWNWNLDRSLIMTLLIMAICTVVWKALHNFKIKRVQEARHNQFFFQNVQNNEIFEILKMFKNSSWLNVYYTKSKRL